MMIELMRYSWLASLWLVDYSGKWWPEYWWQSSHHSQGEFHHGFCWKWFPQTCCVGSEISFDTSPTHHWVRKDRQHLRCNWNSIRANWLFFEAQTSSSGSISRDPGEPSSIFTFSRWPASQSRKCPSSIPNLSRHVAGQNLPSTRPRASLACCFQSALHWCRSVSCLWNVLGGEVGAVLGIEERVTLIQMPSCHHSNRARKWAHLGPRIFWAPGLKARLKKKPPTFVQPCEHKIAHNIQPGCSTTGILR